MPDDDNFRVEYERRHAEIEQRIMRVEMIVTNLVSQKDLADFKATVSTLQESVKQFASITDTVATKKEVEWVRWAMMVLMALVTAHIFGIKLP